MMVLDSGLIFWATLYKPYRQDDRLKLTASALNRLQPVCQ